MKTKKIIGSIIFCIGVGSLVYIYRGYYLPKKEIEALTPSELKKETKTTTTTTKV
jgi:hypothetical protein